VVELSRSVFPICAVVALRAVRPEATVVDVLVTRAAGAIHTEEATAQVVNLYQRFLIRGNSLGRVATIAGEPCMLPFECISGLPVIKGFQIPFDDRKFTSVMLGVTARTLLARSCLDSISGVKPAARSQPFCNFPMTVQASENRLSSAEFVAGRALRGAFQRLMRT
jgi:hypothetical protein